MRLTELKGHAMQNQSLNMLLNTTKERLWLTDGGLETDMIFHEGLDLPQFASFPLLGQSKGREALTRYFNGYLDQAASLNTGFILDTATWRASEGWAGSLGLTAADIDAANRVAVQFARDLRAVRPAQDIVVNGVLGPFGDAYAPDRVLSADEAQDYHARQAGVLVNAGAEILAAMTMSATGEAIGITRAAKALDIPVIVSFTVETDGNLISGQSLADAIAETDAATGAAPVWYGINCAHPDHFRAKLQGDWVKRISMVRANASVKSHAELDKSTELDAGNPDALAHDYRHLQALLPVLKVVGGCCGTDVSHITAIGNACVHHRHAA
jgi:homocysteine S-methyltransferase